VCIFRYFQVVVVQLLSCIQLFATPWTAASVQVPPSFNISWHLLKFISVESVMLSNHLILCCPLLLLPSIFPSIKSFPVSWLFTSGGQRIDVFELWCLRRLLRVPLTARRSNQSILNEISTEYSLEGLMLKLKLQYFGHLMWKANSLEKTWCWERLRAEGEGGSRGWDG